MSLRVLKSNVAHLSRLPRTKRINESLFDATQRAVNAHVGGMIVPDVKNAPADIIVEITIKVENAISRTSPVSVEIYPTPHASGMSVIEHALDEIWCRSECHS
jgi:hypothetical protein